MVDWLSKDSRSQGLCPLDPTPHPLAPSPINGEGEQQAVPLSGVRSTGSGKVTTVCPYGAVPERRRRPQHGPPGMAAQVWTDFVISTEIF